jgi:AcrR family transcriptional regulator
MPYPAQITLDVIVDAARRMIETDGIDALSLGKLAAEIGVKAPSLYGHVANKDALLRAVNVDTMQRLFAKIDAALAISPDDPSARLIQIARVYRAFGHANPHTYMLAMSDPEPARQADPEYLVQLVLPLQALMATISGNEASLTALRGLLALMHGFVMLELADKLQRGGDLGVAYERSIAALIRGWGDHL